MFCFSNRKLQWGPSYSIMCLSLAFAATSGVQLKIKLTDIGIAMVSYHWYKTTMTINASAWESVHFMRERGPGENWRPIILVETGASTPHHFAPLWENLFMAAAGETFKHFAGSPQSRRERAAQNQNAFVSHFPDSPLNALRISLWVGRCLNLTALSP